MYSSLKLIFHRLLDETSTEHYRFLYDQFDLSNRLIGLVGPRGVGKTTLLLQIIKNKFVNNPSVFYFSADHIYFEQTTIYQFIEELYLTEGIETFFIDEIHKYKNWNQELKNLYDGFPKLRLIFSGSSSLDLIKGAYDLSRRTKMYYLPGLSLREYYNFNTKSNIQPIVFQDLLNTDTCLSFNGTISGLPQIKKYFKDYIAKGFYPFYFENPPSYYERILNVIDKSVYEDISNYYNLKTGNLHYFKKILIFLAGIPPGQTSVHNIAKNLSLDDKTVMHYLDILQSAGLIILLHPAESGNQGLRRPEKVFLNNTNLYYVLMGQGASEVNIGTIRELFFIQSLKNASIKVFHNKVGDYKVGKYVFEIGGKNKTKKQIKDIKNAFVIKDDVMIAKTNEIPLLFFGFLF